MIIFTTNKYLIEGMDALLNLHYSRLKLPTAILDLGRKQFVILHQVGNLPKNNSLLEVYLELCTEIISAKELYRHIVQNTSLDKKLTTKPHIAPREKSVLELLLAGRTIAEIAEEFKIGAKTVYTLKDRAIRKLSVRNMESLCYNLNAIKTYMSIIKSDSYRNKIKSERYIRISEKVTIPKSSNHMVSFFSHPTNFASSREGNKVQPAPSE